MKPKPSFCRVFILSLLPQRQHFPSFQSCRCYREAFLCLCWVRGCGSTCLDAETSLVALKEPYCTGTLSSLSSGLWREGCPWEQLYPHGIFLVLLVVCCLLLWAAASPRSLAYPMMAQNHKIMEHPELEGTSGDDWSAAPVIPLRRIGV